MSFYFSLILDYLKKYYLELLLLVGEIVILTFSIYFGLNKREEQVMESEDVSLAYVEENQNTEEVKTEETASTCTVDIKGNVKNPGVYTLDCTSKVMDAITLAGGTLKNTDTSMINLGMTIKNEMVIYVSKKNEITKVTTTTLVTEENKEIPSDAIVTEEETVGEIPIIEESKDNSNNSTTVESNEKTSTNSKININTADVTTLTTLSGIGEAKAKSIITYREENGNFKTIEEIQNVSGIGEAAFEKIKDSITVE